jgi:hypothetical protein
MSLIKKIDVPKYFAARRAMRLGNVQGMSRPGATGGTLADPAAANAAKTASDFSLGHSASSAIVPPKE